jgi:hypothetical protein
MSQRRHSIALLHRNLMAFRVAASIVLTVVVVLGSGCAGPQPATPSQTTATTSPTVAAEPTLGGSFTLAFGGSEATPFEWAPPSGHVFCRWYPEPERGDYVWIRLAQTPEQDGDAGPRLDLDVCRLTTGGSARYAPMSAGAHGSHCAVQPGFAIWWHDEHAYNNGAAAPPDRCWLDLEVDESTGTLAGKFACEPLDAAPHPGGDAQASDPPPSGSVYVLAGQFTCKLERMPAK